jgi:hypothetical protein
MLFTISRRFAFMIYSKDFKMDPKRFIIKSHYTHILLNGYIIKLIKIKIFHDSVLIFYKDKHIFL